MRRDDGTSPHLLVAGEYCLIDGNWYACTPNGLLANLVRHTVMVQRDGTITVSPSIRVDNTIINWHGFLIGGVWDECAVM